MFDLALHHLTDSDRERDTSADLRRRQILKSTDTTTREPRPVARPSTPRINVNSRIAER